MIIENVFDDSKWTLKGVEFVYLYQNPTSSDITSVSFGRAEGDAYQNIEFKNKEKANKVYDMIAAGFLEEEATGDVIVIQIQDGKAEKIVTKRISRCSL